MTVTINTTDGNSHRVENLTREQANELILTFTDLDSQGFYEIENDLHVITDNMTWVNADYVTSVVLRP